MCHSLMQTQFQLSCSSPYEMVFFFLHVLCPGQRQTVLFSATQTRNVEDLARISLRKAPLYVGVDDHKDTSTVDGLEQVNVWGGAWVTIVMDKQQIIVTGEVYVLQIVRLFSVLLNIWRASETLYSGVKLRIGIFVYICVWMYIMCHLYFDPLVYRSLPVSS